jgi:serine/threonine protein kinase/WD40 repeat protein/tetratricopeptide (TPR) repeat protein
MTDVMSGDDVTLPSDKKSLVEDLSRNFRLLWESNKRPRIEEFLPLVPADQRGQLLQCLLRIEYESQSASGETFALRDYRQAFPEYRDVIDSVIAELTTGKGSPDPTVASKGAATKGSATKGSTGGTQKLEDTLVADLGASDPHGAKGSRISPASVTAFGDYDLLEEIARGGMGVVYKARQRKLNRIVAIKMILSGQFASSEDIQRFYSEAEAAARLDHRGIVPIYEVDQIDGRHFFSMGFVEGDSLQHRVARGPLPQREAVQLVRHVAEAVQYAHQHGVIHRDLKPRNILIGRDGHPRVTDFGLAKTLETESGLTVSGQILGTPGYMPPEQASGKLKDVGPQADVYALGAVLYCLLTGRPPFQSASAVETIKQLLETPPVSPRVLNPAIDRDLETICLKCLEKKATHRYQSAQEFADELDRYLAGEPIRARRIGVLGKSWRWVRRRPLVAALALSLLLMAVVIPLSASYVMRSYQASSLVDLRRTIDRRLNEPQLTEAWLSEVDALLDKLAKRRPELAEEDRPRLNAAFGAAIQRELDRPRLDNEVAELARGALTLLEPRDPKLAADLRAELDRRLSDWQEVFTLMPPMANAAELLQGNYQIAGDRLLPVVPKEWNDAPIPSRASSEGIVKLEAQFDEHWEKSARLGLSLKSEGGHGYDFFLQADDAATLREEGSATVTSKNDDVTFASIRAENGYFTLAIYRNGLVLLREQVHHAKIPPGPLVLRASCELAQLKLQAMPAAAVSIRDPFPLPARQAGVFAVRLPRDVGLLKLAASRKPKTAAESPLEKGDELFEQGQYELALQQYRQQSIQSGDGEFQQESRYKHALCLMQLGRLDDAANEFGGVFKSPGERWPPIAGCQLWLIRFRQKQTSEANVVFDELSDRFRFNQVASLIPNELRQELLSYHQSDLLSLGTFVRFDPDLMQRIARFAAVDRFLSLDGRGRELQQIEVARAYHLLGDIPSAIEAAAPIAKGTLNATVARHYIRFLRLNGDHYVALAELDAFEERQKKVGEPRYLLMLLERARILAGLEQWTRCEEAMELFLQQYRDGQFQDPRQFSYYALVQGMLLERKGARGPAIAIWRTGYKLMRPELQKATAPATEYMNAVIMGSLSGELTLEEAQQFFSSVASRGADNAFLRQAQTIVGAQAIAGSIQTMWRTPLGRKYAADFAYERLSLRDRVKAPLLLLASEYVNQNAFQAEITPEQHQAIFDSLARIYDEAIFDGKLSISHVAQIILTWKGTANFLGWGGVSPSLSKPSRAGMAYMFAHRYLQLGDLPQAMKFLDTVLADAPAGSVLAKYAAQDKELLAGKRGRLIVASDVPEKTQLRIAQGGQMIATADISALQEIDVPAGELELSLVTPRDDIRLSRTQVRMTTMGRRAIDVKWLWKPSVEHPPLTGLLPQPATNAVGVRWQVVPTHSVGEIKALAWSPTSDRFVVGASDGLLRIYDATSQRVVGLLSESPQFLEDVIWSPSADHIVAAGLDKWIRSWNPQTGQLWWQRPDHAVSRSSLAWRGDATQFVSGNHVNEFSLIVWNTNGAPVRAYSTDFAANASAFSHDGHWLAQRSSDGKAVDVIEAETGKSRRLTDGQHWHNHIAFSPDSRLLASGGDLEWLQIWKTEDWSTWKSFSFPSPQGRICGLAWTPDRRLLVGVYDVGILEFDVAADPPAEVKRHPSPYLARIALSPDGKRVVAASSQGKLSLIDRADGHAESFGALRRDQRTLAVRPASERQIAVGGEDGVLRFFDQQGRLLGSHPLETPQRINQLAWSKTGEQLAGALAGGSLAIWKADGSLQAIHADKVLDRNATLAWNDRSEIVVHGKDYKIHTLRSGDGSEVSSWPDEANDNVVFDASGERITSWVNGKLHLRDHAGKDDFISGDKVSPPQAIAWSRPKSLLATRGNGRNVSLWNADGELIMDLPLAENRADSLAWSPSGDQLAICNDTGAVEIWSSAGKRVMDFPPSLHCYAHAVVWLDDNRLASVGDDGCLRFFNLAAGPQTTTLLLPDQHWARFTSGGQLLEASGPLEDKLLYAVENTQGGVDLLPPSDFSRRVGLPLISDKPVDAPTTMPRPRVDAPSMESEQLVTRELARLNDPAILESSGLAASGRDDAIWTHNDDEKNPRLYLVNKSGETLARYDLETDKPNDWEDLCSFVKDDKRYLLIGDIGDNFHRRQEVLLHLVREPDLEKLPDDVGKLPIESTIAFKYEDGRHDCEALAVDVERNVALLITKELDESCLLFEVPLDKAGKPVVAKKVRELKLPLVTAMDISPDGRRLVVLGGLHAFEYTRAEGETWQKALDRVPRRYALPEAKQAEAIAYRRDGKALLLTSEGERSPLWEMELPE